MSLFAWRKMVLHIDMLNWPEPDDQRNARRLPGIRYYHRIMWTSISVYLDFHEPTAYPQLEEFLSTTTEISVDSRSHLIVMTLQTSFGCTWLVKKIWQRPFTRVRGYQCAATERSWATNATMYTLSTSQLSGMPFSLAYTYNTASGGSCISNLRIVFRRCI